MTSRPDHVIASDLEGATRKVVNKFWIDRTQPPDPEKFTGHLAVAAYNQAKKAWDEYQTFLTTHKTGTTRGLKGTAAAADKTRADEIFVPNFKFQFSDKNTVRFKGNINDTRYGTWVQLPKLNGKRIKAQEYISKNPSFFMSKVDYDHAYQPITLTDSKGKKHTLTNQDQNYFKYIGTKKDDKGVYLPDPKATSNFTPAAVVPIRSLTNETQPEIKEEINNNTNGLTIKNNGSKTNELTIKPVNSNQKISSKVNETLVASSDVKSSVGIVYGNEDKVTKRESDPLVPNEMPGVWARKWAGGTGESLKSVNARTEAYLTSKGWNFDSIHSMDKADLFADFRTGRAKVFTRPDGQYLHYNNRVIFNPSKPSNSELSQTVALNQNKAVSSIAKSNSIINSTKTIDEDAV